MKNHSGVDCVALGIVYISSSPLPPRILVPTSASQETTWR